MKYKLEGVPKQHRNFGLVMDEMSIQAKLEFDIASQFHWKANSATQSKNSCEKERENP